MRHSRLWTLVSIYLPLASCDPACLTLIVFQVSQQAAKCIPSMVCPELTEQIRREIAASLHQRKGDFACYFLTDLVTFTLPAGTRTIFMTCQFFEHGFLLHVKCNTCFVCTCINVASLVSTVRNSFFSSRTRLNSKG